MTNFRASYRRATWWIAENDQLHTPTSTDVGVVANYHSVRLVAHMFRKNPDEVALEVVKARRRSAMHLKLNVKG